MTRMFDFKERWFADGNWTNANLPPDIAYHLVNQPLEFFVFQIIAAITSIICLTLAVIQIIRFRQVGNRVRKLRNSVFLPIRTELLLSLAVFPACLAFCQLLGLIFIRQARLVLLLSDLHTSVVLSRFWSFIVGIFGGAEKVVSIAGMKKPYRVYATMPLCFIGFLMPKKLFTARDLRHSRLAVGQFTVLAPIASIVRAFNNGVVNVEQLLNYMTALSMLICMWGLHVLTRALIPHLNNTLGMRVVIETTVIGTRVITVLAGINGVVKGRDEKYTESVMIMAVTNFCVNCLASMMAIISFIVFSSHKIHSKEIDLLEQIKKVSSSVGSETINRNGNISSDDCITRPRSSRQIKEILSALGDSQTPTTDIFLAAYELKTALGHQNITPLPTREAQIGPSTACNDVSVMNMAQDMLSVNMADVNIRPADWTHLDYIGFTLQDDMCEMACYDVEDELTIGSDTVDTECEQHNADDMNIKPAVSPCLVVPAKTPTREMCLVKKKKLECEDVILTPSMTPCLVVRAKTPPTNQMSLVKKRTLEYEDMIVTPSISRASATKQPTSELVHRPSDISNEHVSSVSTIRRYRRGNIHGKHRSELRSNYVQCDTGILTPRNMIISENAPTERSREIVSKFQENIANNKHQLHDGTPPHELKYESPCLSVARQIATRRYDVNSSSSYSASLSPDGHQHLEGNELSRRARCELR